MHFTGSAHVNHLQVVNVVEVLAKSPKYVKRTDVVCTVRTLTKQLAVYMRALTNMCANAFGETTRQKESKIQICCTKRHLSRICTICY